MPTLDELVAGKYQRRPGTTTYVPTSSLDTEETGPVPPVERQPKPVTLDDLVAGRATRNPDGTHTWHEKTAAAADGGGLSETAYNLWLSGQLGVTSGIQSVGSLMELLAPETGKALRESGTDWSEHIVSRMNPEWQEAVNRKWTELSKEGAFADWRWWASNIAQQVPYMIGTGGVGELTALGIRGAAGLAGKQIAKTAARRAGYATAGGAAAAGEGASGAAQAADAAGLSDEQRRRAMLTGAAISAPFGAFAGQKLESLLSGRGGFARGVGASVAGEMAEEGGTGLGTEVGKWQEGLGFDPMAVLEQSLAGGGIGLGTGVAVSGPASAAAALRNRAQAKRTDAATRAGAAEAQALIEKEAAKLRDELAKKEKDEQALAGKGAAEVQGVAQAAQARQAAATTPMGQLQPRPLGAAPAVWGGPTGEQVQTAPATEVGQQAAVAAAQQAAVQPAAMTKPPPPARPSIWTESTTGGALAPETEAGNQHLQSLQQTIEARSNEVALAQARLDATGTNPASKVRFTAQLREAQRQHSLAVKRHEDYFAQRSRKLKLPLAGETDLAGMPIDSNATSQAADNLLNDEIRREVDEAFGQEGMEDTPLWQSAKQREVQEKALRRSQQAQAAAAARWAKHRAANIGPGQAIQPAPEPNIDARAEPLSNKLVGHGGNAEQSAVRARVPGPKKSPTVVEAAQQPTTVAAAQPAEGAAPGVPLPPPGATAGPVPPPSPGQPLSPPAPGQPLSPPAPQPQRGGVMSAPSVIIPGLPPQMDPTSISPLEHLPEVIGEAPPAPVLPGVEAQLQQTTKPRKKPLGRLTPRERLRKVLADGPRGVDIVLAAIQDAMGASKDTRTLKLVEQLRKAFPHSAEHPLRVIVEARKLAEGIQGIYDPKTDRIYIDLDQAEDVINATLHEAVHAATLYKIRINHKLRRDLTDMMNRAVKAWKRMGWQPDADSVYGFSKVEDFISEALTNPGFADKLAALPIIGPDNDFEEHSIWRRFKRRLSIAFGMVPAPSNDLLFNHLLEMVIDGSFLPDGNRQEMLQQLDNLGLSQAAGLLTTLRSMYRPNLANPNIASAARGRYKAGGKGRVWIKQLPLLGMGQLAQSYGDVGKFFVDINGQEIAIPHDWVNTYVRQLDERDGHVAAMRALAAKILGVGKQSVSLPDADPTLLDDVLVNSTMWGLWADKGAFDPENVRGMLLPGRAALHAKLEADWARLNPIQQDFYRLVTFNSQAQRTNDMQGIMVWRVRQTLGEAAAKDLEHLIESQTLISNEPGGPGTGGAPSDIVISYHDMPTAADLQIYVQSMQRIHSLSPKRARQLYKDIRQVQKAFGERVGPYVPLRRVGEFYTMLRTREFTMLPMDKVAYEQLVADNQLLHDGDLEIVDEGYDAATDKYKLRVRHIFVNASDSERDAVDHMNEKKRQWDARGLTSMIADERAAAKQEDVYSGLALQSASVEALRRDVSDILTRQVGKAAGEAANDAILKYYLEKLPEGSLRKSQMRARLIAGPTRDMMHVYSEYANGAAYFSGQMKYGSDMSTTLNAHAKQAISFLQEKGQTAQANDLQHLQNFLTKRDGDYDRASAKDALKTGQDWFGLQTIWRRFPQITAAWLLTGPGTTLINGLQAAAIAAPHFSARHGVGPTISTMLAVYRDTIKPIAGETTREVGRALKGTPGALKVLAGARKYTPEIRNPRRSMVEQVMDNLPDQMEQEHLHALAMRKKIDFGLVADAQSISERASGRWMATQYMMDAAFIVPQAMETTNRINVGLTSFRLNRAKITADVMADPNIAAADKQEAVQRALLDIAAKDIDQTMWNYSASARPNIFQHEIMRFAQVFKTYAQNMTYSILHNITQSFVARTPEERKIARKFIAGVFITTAATAGMMGWITLDPFYIIAVALTMGFTDDDDPEQALREAMTDWMGEEWMPMINTLLKGPIYAAGWADLSRTAFPSMVNWQSDEGSAYARIGETIAGAPGSLIEQMWKGGVALTEGNYARAVEQLTPKAIGINDIARAINYANKGVVDSQGEAYIGSKELNWLAVIRRGLGFDAPYISEKKGIRRTYFVREQAARDKHNEVLSDYVDAVRAKDKPARKKALAAIKQFNRDYRGFGITRDGIHQALKGRIQKEHTIAKYGVDARRPGQRRLLRQIERRYGARGGGRRSSNEAVGQEEE